MAQPPSFYGGSAPRIARLPTPINPAAPLAQGINQLADAVDRAGAQAQASDQRLASAQLEAAHIERQRELQVRTGDIAAQLATRSGELNDSIVALRQNSDPGHLDRVEQAIGAFRDGMFDYIGPDAELRARFADNIATAAASIRSGEVKWSAVQSAEKSASDFDVLDNAVGSTIRTAVMNGTADGKTIANATAQRATAIDALPVDGATKEKLKKEGFIKDNVTAMSALIDVDPHAALAQIDKGALGMADDKTVQVLRNHAREMADQADNKVEQQANEAAAVGRAQARNLIEDVNGGVHVDTVQLQTYYAAVSASAKPEDVALAHDLKVAIARNETTAKYDNSTQDERLAALRAIEGHKGWQQDEQLTAAHSQLQTLIGRDDQAAEHDQISLYARQAGQALPALNLADPASMGQRFVLGERAGQRFGKPPAYFTDREASDLRTQFNSGTPQAKAQFIEQLAAFGSNRARTMMRQIAPNNPRLARLTELAAYRDPAIRSIVAEALDGAEQPAKDGTAAAVRNAAMQQYAGALARLPGDRAKAIIEVATNIYAHRAATDAKAGHFNKQVALDSVAAALGGANGKGGFGRARNGDTIVLPAGVSQHDFDAIVGTATGKELGAAANGSAFWRQGQPLTNADLRGLTPVLLTDTGTQSLYVFRSKGGSGFVKTQRGDDFVVDFRKLVPVVKSGDGTLDAQLRAHGYVRK
jgi:hypothetical protein